MADNLTAKEVAKICGITDRTLRRWTTAGYNPYFPGRIKKEKRWYFPPIEFCRWLQDLGKEEEYTRLVGFLAGQEPDGTQNARAKIETQISQFTAALAASAEATPRKPQAETAIPDGELDELLAETDGNWDIFRIRDNTARMYTHALRMYMRAPPHAKIAHQKNANDIADLMRKLESDCLSVAKELKLVMLMTDVETLVGSILASVKNDLLKLPYTVAEDLAVMSDAKSISEYLHARVVDCLRHTSRALTEIQENAE